jgi:hypothetical protein
MQLYRELVLVQVQQIHQVELICENVENCSFENSSVVVINYTLQFCRCKSAKSCSGLFTRG